MVWVIEGPFDGTVPGDIDHKKQKLLKCGRTYVLGRKARNATNLVISHPKVSGQHASFIVGQHSAEDAAEINKRPSLTVQNLRTKMMHLRRNDVTTIINPSAEQTLEDGDKIALVTGIIVEVRWRRVSSYVAAQDSPFDMNDCAELGLKVTSTHHPDVTHHLTPLLTLSPSIAISLLTVSQLVTPAWMTEYLRLGQTVKEASPEDGQHLSLLEYEFTPPAESKFKPEFDTALPQNLKAFKTWEPNEERTGLFRGRRFVLVGELAAEVKEIVEKGEGAYESFDISGGPARWKQVLARNKRKAESDACKGISVIADVDAGKLAAGDQWNEFWSISRSFGLRIIDTQQLLEAVIHVDSSRIDSTSGTDVQEEASTSSLPERVPNTYPDESVNTISAAAAEPSGESESSVAQARPRLVRRARAASRAPSPIAVEDIVPVASSSKPTEEAPLPAKPRKPLIRRARAEAAALLGVDDPSVIEPEPPLLDSGSMKPPSERQDLPAPETNVTQSGSRPRLKRRAKTETPYNPLVRELERETNDEDAPPLKKFKALFDETDPDRLASQSGVDYGTQIYSQNVSQTQSETTGERRDTAARPNLRAIAEEVEESPSQLVHEPPTVDTPMEGVRNTTSTNTVEESAQETPLDSGAPTLQSAPTTRKPSKSGQVDKDDAFLKALASRKRGKKKEDEFDREFNNLRISKPERDKDDQADQWAVLDDFETNDNLKGNFMVIVEMDVPEKTPSERARSETPVEWAGKPNFKKFKKKDIRRERPAVELVVTDENDYGMGSAYWRNGSQSQSQSQGDMSAALLQPSQTQNKKFLQPASQKPSSSKASQFLRAPSVGPRRGRSASPTNVVEEDEERPVRPDPSRRTRGSGGTQIKKQSQSQAPALFLPDPDEEDNADYRSTLNDDSGEQFDLNVSGGSDDEEQPKKSRKAAPTTQTKASSRRNKRTVDVLDDDDTGVAFKGFGGRKKTRLG